jgi:hypothetical protein
MSSACAICPPSSLPLSEGEVGKRVPPSFQIRVGIPLVKRYFLGYMKFMKLDQWLTRHKITSRAFAKMAGFSLAAVCKWRQGDRIPRLKAMKKIAFLTKRKVTSGDFY